MLKCEICGRKYSDNYYVNKYTGTGILCEECLLEIDGITTETETAYYLDGEYMGSDSDIDTVIESILNNTEYEKLEEE